MKRTTKLLWILFAVGMLGIVATGGYMYGTDALMSREAAGTYAADAPFDTVQLDTSLAQTSILPLESGEARVEAYAKAWLPGAIDMDEVVNVIVRDGVLIVTETPFPTEFLGLFPQPYELTLRVYVPQDVYEKSGDIS